MSNINAEFNKQLVKYIKGTHKGTDFDLGLPSKILLNTGLEDFPIRLTKRVLTQKIKKHKFDIRLLKDLPEKIANPVMIFDSKTDKNTKILVVGGFVKNEGILSVVLSKDKYKNYVINKIKSLGGRDVKQLWYYIEKGLLRYSKKNKILKHLPEALIASDSKHQDYDAKIREYFKLSKPAKKQDLSGFGAVSSMELKNMTFKTLPFTGDWEKLIGHPSVPFHIMFYGKAGSGKSTISVQLAHYLASAHNMKVLFVAKEEGISSTT
ncbi:MAG: hypothetical protein L3J74_06310, partial [Bacteroidales bacterium]|nr:hypothetical protein [Bacteroidales bacterium]